MNLPVSFDNVESKTNPQVIANKFQSVLEILLTTPNLFPSTL
jgi:hypothetical protein